MIRTGPHLAGAWPSSRCSCCWPGYTAGQFAFATKTLGDHTRRLHERLCAGLPDWAQASVWFCGPPHFGRALRADLVVHGLPAERFHQEPFQMR